MLKPCFFSYGGTGGFIWAVMGVLIIHFQKIFHCKDRKATILGIPHDYGNPMKPDGFITEKHGESSARMKVSRRQPWFMVYIYIIINKR